MNYITMVRRATIMIEDDLDKKIRAYQAKKCKKKMPHIVILKQSTTSSDKPNSVTKIIFLQILKIFVNWLDWKYAEYHSFGFE